MNLYLHGVGDLKKTPDIQITDSLKANDIKKVMIVLANPPFGKSSSDIPTNDAKIAEKDGYFLRQDFWVTTGNKQLAFVQHIVNMLEGEGRAAVVLPDNVLFEGGAGEIIRRKLLEEVHLHTILRLPTGIFYAQGVNANVLFFDKKPASKKAKNEVWFYDYRTNIHHTPKKSPLSFNSLLPFVECYNESKREETWGKDNPLGRWRKYSNEEILARDKVNFDITWLKDESSIDMDALPEPDVLIGEIIDSLEAVLNNLKNVKDSVS
jgi:type I restriction enzyme M protein